jgi:hypothetical protein
MSISTTSGRGTAYCLDCVGTVDRFGDHVDAVAGEDHPEAGPDQRLVVGDHHAQRHGHGASRGISAVTR